MDIDAHAMFLAGDASHPAPTPQGERSQSNTFDDGPSHWQHPSPSFESERIIPATPPPGRTLDGAFAEAVKAVTGAVEAVSGAFTEAMEDTRESEETRRWDPKMLRYEETFPEETRNPERRVSAGSLDGPARVSSASFGVIAMAAETEANSPRGGRGRVGSPTFADSTGAGVGSLDMGSDDQTRRISTLTEATDGVDGDATLWLGAHAHKYAMGQMKSEAVTVYSKRIATRAPCCCATFGIIVVCVVCGLGLGFLGIEVETNFESFMKTDVNSSAMRDGFLAALSQRGGSVTRRLTEAPAGPSRRLTGAGPLTAVLYQSFDIFIAYELKEGSNHRVFDKHVIAEIARFERKLTSTREWIEYCRTMDREDQAFCMPGISVAHYVLPSLEIGEEDVVPSSMTFNSGGKEQVPLETTLKLLESYKLTRIMLPLDFDAGTSRFVRSVFRFKFYCCTSLDPTSLQRDQVHKFTGAHVSFLKDIALPFLQDHAAGTSNAESFPFNIYWAGHNIEELEVMQTLQGDIALAAGSMIFVLLYIICHTRSVFLGIMGIILMLLAVPFSFVLFAIISGTTKLSIASFLSLFLVVGLGSDVIFVYTDFWRDSLQFHTRIEDRFLWTQKNAGKASLATSATTAISFFANLASVLRPLREFGTFMGLCVVVVWLLITVLFLPLLIVDEKYFSQQRRCFGGKAEKGAPPSFWSLPRLLVLWETKLVHWKKTCLFSSIAVALLAFGLAGANMTTDTSGTPTLFPKDHNQGHGKEVMARFAPANDIFSPNYPMPPQSQQVCKEWEFKGSDNKCVLFWCEVDKDITKTERDNCNCFRKKHPITPKCQVNSKAVVSTRFVGRKELSREAMLGPIRDSIQHSGELTVNGIRDMNLKPLAPMLLQEWVTGDVMYKGVTDVVTTALRKNANVSCGWQDICFCGTYICQLPKPDFSWLERPVVLTSQTSRTLRGLQSETHALKPHGFPILPSNKRADIAVVFGIVVEGGSQLLGERDASDAWSFAKAYQVRQPWAQRNVYNLCTMPPAALRVAKANCWIVDFRIFLDSRKERFPVHASRFDNLVMQFLQVGLTGMASTKEYLWIKNGKVQAAFVQFLVDFSQGAPVGAVMAYKEEWNLFMAQYNTRASRFARGAWHTSQLWVRAEAQSELINSTINVLLICLGLAFAVMLVFTFDPTLSFFVVISTLMVICLLFFFIVCIKDWPIGPVEVIALIVFIGYAVTYSLHITHKYGDREALNFETPNAELEMDERAALRYQRTGFAFHTIGGPAVGSAVTTCGCSVFLIYCTLTIFQKLGGVVLAVTLMSILMALVPLPAALLLYGPLDPGRVCCPWHSKTLAPKPAAARPSVLMYNVRQKFRDSPANPRTQLAEAAPKALGPAMPGDGVIMATAIVGQDARKRHPSFKFRDVTAPYITTPTGSRPSPSSGSSGTTWENATSVDAVHIDVSDPDYEICDEQVFSSANTRQAKGFTMLGRGRSPKASHGGRE